MNSENMTLDEGQKCLREAIGALRSKNSDGSRTAALKAIEMGEDGAAVWGVLALACRDQGDFDMAQKAADRSIELEPRNVRAHIVKADAFYAESNARAAAAFYRHALAMSAPQPDMPEEILLDLFYCAHTSQYVSTASSMRFTKVCSTLVSSGLQTSKIKITLS